MFKLTSNYTPLANCTERIIESSSCINDCVGVTDEANEEEEEEAEEVAEVVKEEMEVKEEEETKAEEPEEKKGLVL